MQANAGDISRTLLFGFNEPYIRNRPLNFGFQIFDNKYDYNATKNYKLSGGNPANLSNAQQSLLQKYNQSSTGFSVSARYPIHQQLQARRLYLRFNHHPSRHSVRPRHNLFQTLAFRSGIQGQNALTASSTARRSFSFTMNKLDAAYQPHHGPEFSAILQVAGIWGNVRYFSPVLEYKQLSPHQGTQA